MKIAIVTCCSTDWLPYALATHLSAARNNTLELDHFAVTDTADAPRVKDWLANFSSQHGFAVHHLPFNDRGLLHHKSGLYPVSCLYRLKLAELLPAGYDRVLYLDSDVLVLRSIDKLLLSDFQGFAISAIEDIWMNIAPTQTNRDQRLAIGFAGDEAYFNSGVMLMDWEKVQAERIFEGALARLLENNFHYADQDALNMELRGRWRKLPLEFNVLSIVDDFTASRPIIRHFTDSRKPWKPEFRIQDIAHRRFYSKFLTALDGRPALGLMALPSLAKFMAATFKHFKKHLKCLLRNQPYLPRLHQQQIKKYIADHKSRYGLD